MVELYLRNLIREDNYLKAGSDKFIKIKVSGHAGYDKINNDVVCAAISAIIQTAVVAITRVCRVHQDLKQGSGYLETIIRIDNLKPFEIRDLNTVLNTMLTGLEEIKKIYPESLKIIFNNE